MKIGIRIEHFVPGSNSQETLSYDEIREIAQIVEHSNLDSIWLSDHLLYRFDPEVTVGPWECWTLLSALAEATNRVELGTMVLCNPFRNPALLAKMAHTLDEISGGRLILGLGAGWHQPEFDAFGYPFDRRVDRLEEALQILHPLLKGERVDFVGTYYQVRDCMITPVGPRAEGIPLLLAAFGPRMLRLAARYADLWNTAWLGDPQGLTEPLSKLETACIDVGRDPATLAITASISITFPDLGNAQPFAQEPLSGSDASIVAALQQFSAAGTSHLIVQYTPANIPALERLAEIVEAYRSASR